MNLSDEIVNDLKGVWHAATMHTFTEDLCSDVLNDLSWQKYLIQDYAFVGALTELVKTMIDKCPGHHQREVFEGFLDVLTGAEDQFFIDAFQKANVPESQWSSEEESEVTINFKELFNSASGGSYADVLSVLLPVEWVYLTWATKHKNSNPRDSYNEWILLHNNAEFTEFVMFLKSEFDVASQNHSQEDRERMKDYFSTACELEVLFFDHCYVKD